MSKVMIYHNCLRRWLGRVTYNNMPLTQAFVEDLLSVTAGGVLPQAFDTPGNATLRLPSDLNSRPLDHVLGDSDTTAFAVERAPVEARTTMNLATDVPPSGESGFVFGRSSEKELMGVEPQLVRVVRLALTLSSIDFVVFDGIRSVAEQLAHVRKGMSETMVSKHLVGLAVDLVPYIGGRPTWDWEGCYRIAFAMAAAANRLECAENIIWGGAWDRTLADIISPGGERAAFTIETFRRVVEDYKKRHAGPDFIDGPHFEWRK